MNEEKGKERKRDQIMNQETKALNEERKPT